MSPVRREVMAALVRQTAAEHDDWDVPHRLIGLHLDGGQIRPGWAAVLLGDIDPERIPDVLVRFAAEHLAEDPGRPPYAYLFEWEGWGVVEPDPDATAEERAAYEEATRNRGYHQHPDRLELVTVTCADVHGRMWKACKRRDTGYIGVQFFPPAAQLRGRFDRAVRRIAETTGELVRDAN